MRDSCTTSGSLSTNRKEHIAKVSLESPNECAIVKTVLVTRVPPPYLISTSYVCVYAEGTEENHISNITGCQADNMLIRMNVSGLLQLARPFSIVLALLISKSVLSKTNTM